MTHYFISDLHLQASHPKMTDGFLQLLTRLQGAESLYILGDFFEVWIGDDYDDPTVSAIKSGLKGLSESGTAVYLMHGNRDFLMGNAFAEQAGATLLDEGTVITIGDQQALLMHGDSLCTLDTAYMQMRQMFRNPAWQQQILSQPIPARLQLAASIRSESQTGQQMKADDIMDVTPDEVVKEMEKAGVNLLIHGHTHRPAVHKDDVRTRMVLGDWSDEHGWLIRWEAGSEPVLEQFAL